MHAWQVEEVGLEPKLVADRDVHIVKVLLHALLMLHNPVLRQRHDPRLHPRAVDLPQLTDIEIVFGVADMESQASATFVLVRPVLPLPMKGPSRSSSWY